MRSFDPQQYCALEGLLDNLEELSFSHKTACNFNPGIISNHLLSSSDEKVRQQSDHFSAF
jgi:hypothetical protein